MLPPSPSSSQLLEAKVVVWGWGPITFTYNTQFSSDCCTKYHYLSRRKSSIQASLELWTYQWQCRNENAFGAFFQIIDESSRWGILVVCSLVVWLFAGYNFAFCRELGHEVCTNWAPQQRLTSRKARREAGCLIIIMRAIIGLYAPCLRLWGHTMKSDSCIQRRVGRYNGHQRPPKGCPQAVQGHRDKSKLCITWVYTLYILALDRWGSSWKQISWGLLMTERSCMCCRCCKVSRDIFCFGRFWSCCWHCWCFLQECRDLSLKSAKAMFVSMQAFDEKQHTAKECLFKSSLFSLDTSLPLGLCLGFTWLAETASLV